MRILLTLLLLLTPPALPAQTAEPPMTPLRLVTILRALDPETAVARVGITLTIQDVPVLVVADERMNRMRAMVPIRLSEPMSAEEMQRVLQANFDTALDARYAIANGRLWAVFIHPLRELQRDQLISGIGQTVNIAQSYGTLYSGGAAQFGSGDSADLQAELLEDLLERGRDL